MATNSDSPPSFETRTSCAPQSLTEKGVSDFSGL
jgi:hypothetical protein